MAKTPTGLQSSAMLGCGPYYGVVQLISMAVIASPELSNGYPTNTVSRPLWIELEYWDLNHTRHTHIRNAVSYAEAGKLTITI